MKRLLKQNNSEELEIRSYEGK